MLAVSIPAQRCLTCLALLAGCAGQSAPSGDSQSISGDNGVRGGPNDAFGNADGPPMLSGGAGSGEPVRPRGCNDLVVAFEPVIPDVLLLVDRSGSMFMMPYGSSPTRWHALDDALMHPESGVVAAYQSQVRFGLMTYTGNSQAGTCPILRYVPPALDNHGALRALYDEESVVPTFKAETPTGAGLRAALAELMALPADATRHIILVTDGEPDDCTTPDPQCGQDQSIAAVQSAFDQGIGTSVIGISSDVSGQHLQDLANAGSGQPVRPPDMQYMYNCINPGYATRSAAYAGAGQPEGSAPIYQPADAQAIASALETLIRGVTGCSFELNGEVVLEEAHLGTVLLDGERLIYQDANGWRMRDSRVLQLQGAACERVQAESNELVISFPCDVVDLL